MNHFKVLIERAKQCKNQKTIVVANAEDIGILKSIKLAINNGLANFILLGDEHVIKEGCKLLNLSLGEEALKIHHIKINFAQTAVEFILNNQADLIMKGNVSTKELLQAVLKRTNGLRTNQLLSHVAIFDVPDRSSPIILTDAAVNIAPSLNEKVEIVEHAVQCARMLGIELPKVAAIAPVDVINEAIPSTLDAAKLTEMQALGEIKNCLIGGPISFDNAISPESAKHKKNESDIRGTADILLVPTIEVGNALYKSFTFFAHARVAAIVCGAKVPIILSSRADTAESKLYSIALGLMRK